MTKADQWSYVADKTMKEIFDAAKTSAIIVHLPDDTYGTNKYNPASIHISSGQATIQYGDGSYLYNEYSDNETSWNIPD